MRSRVIGDPALTNGFDPELTERSGSRGPTPDTLRCSGEARVVTKHQRYALYKRTTRNGRAGGRARQSGLFGVNREPPRMHGMQLGVSRDNGYTSLKIESWVAHIGRHDRDRSSFAPMRS